MAIIKCTCQHEWQDEKYGVKKRVHNASGKERNGFTCTVCGTKKEVTGIDFSLDKPLTSR